MEYTIRHMRHEDSEAVSKLFVLSYGDTYDIPAVYHPEEEEALDRSGRVLSFVALANGTQVVGHYAITVDELSRIGEGGEAVVHPDHRGQKLLERMRSFAEDYVAKAGMPALFFEPVTVHTFSQHANEADGAKICGINLGVSPRGTSYTGIASDTSTQRVSMVLYFKALSSIAERTILVPESDGELVTIIFDHLQLPYRWGVPHPVQGPGVHLLNADCAHGFAFARVQKIGSDTLKWILEAKQNFIRVQHGETFHVDLPLTDGDLNPIVDGLKAEGFRCIGVVPEFHPNGPVVRYAYLTEVYDPQKIQILSPFGRQLLDKILS